MQVQLDFANKEKAALQTILEGKVLPLAEEVGKGLSILQADAVHGGDGGSMTDRMAQQVTTLQRLLSATVAAMARASNSSAAAKQQH